jgi:hypothetical protein
MSGIQTAWARIPLQHLLATDLQQTVPQSPHVTRWGSGGTTWRCVRGTRAVVPGSGIISTGIIVVGILSSV